MLSSQPLVRSFLLLGLWAFAGCRETASPPPGMPLAPTAASPLTAPRSRPDVAVPPRVQSLTARTRLELERAGLARAEAMALLKALDRATSTAALDERHVASLLKPGRATPEATKRAVAALSSYVRARLGGAAAADPRGPLVRGASVCGTCGAPNDALGAPTDVCQYQSGQLDLSCSSQFFSVDLTQGARYAFTLCEGTCGEANTELPARVRIYDPECNVVSELGAFCGSTSALEWTATTTGTHRVEVTADAAEVTGAYNLGFRRLCADAPSDCSTPLANLAEPTTRCQTAAGNLTCGASASYSVTLTQGQTYTFTSCSGASCSGANAAFDSAIEVYRNGALVASNAGSEACGTSGEVVLPTDPMSGGGQYCVRIVRESGEGAYSLGYRVACQAPSSLSVGPAAGGATTATCSTEQTFVVNSAGTGPFTYAWSIAPRGAGTAFPSTRTFTGVPNTDAFTTTLTSLGVYDVQVIVTNDCGTATHTLPYTLGDAAGPDIECTAATVECPPIVSERRGRAPSASVRASSNADALKANLSTELSRLASARADVAALLLREPTARHAQRAIATRLGLDPSRVAVREEAARGPRHALIGAPGLSCAERCLTGTLSAAHPFYDVFLSCDNGAFTARTGAQHSVTVQSGNPQNVIYGGANGSPGTSDITLRVHDTNASYLNPTGGAACVFNPDDTTAEPNSVGLEQEWSLSPMMGMDLTLRHELVAFGSQESNSGVRMSLSVSNSLASTETAHVGFRWQVDYQNAEDDGPGFAPVQCRPFSVTDEIFAEAEIAPGSVRDFYRIQNNTGSPIFGNFTSTGPVAGYAGTAAPDRLVYGNWGNLVESDWNYATRTGTNADGDSATLLYYGFVPASGLAVPPGETIVRSVVIFTAGQNQSCGNFEPGNGSDGILDACGGTCVRVGATATDACGVPSVTLKSASAGAPSCVGADCTLDLRGTPPGTYVYTFEAEDSGGNKSTCRSIVTVSANSDATCNDGNACNGVETCAAGQCAVGEAPNCNDNNPCTADACDPAVGCTHTPIENGTPCSEGDICTGFSVCQNSVCTPQPALNCNDDNPCTRDRCDTKGGCLNEPLEDGASCSDGNACNGPEACREGTCVRGPAPNCNDEDPCTVDSCDAATGCVNTPAPEGASCADGNACNGAETCSEGFCVEGTPPSCDDNNPCTADSCDPARGCVHTPVENGLSCSDGNACNGAEVCQAGVCVGGAAPRCDDGNPCTADSCDPTRGCVASPVTDGTACADGNVCNGAETCRAGVCTAGAPLSCDDGNACTADACDPVTGCSHTNVADGTTCDDGNACNGVDRCAAGRCVSASPPQCDDGNPCTIDSCDPEGGCQHRSAVDGTACSDGNACNGLETCRAGTCTAGTAPRCDDGNVCTADRCDAEVGCVFAPRENGTSCSDGNACNGVETCQAGACARGEPVRCSNPGACRTALGATCDPQTGACSYPNLTNGAPCPDNDVCNGQETCQAGACTAGSPLRCDDGNPCTVKRCEPVRGCVALPAADGTACSDGNACNGAETCVAGVCTAGAAPRCDDSNPCTTDRCDPARGCVFTAVNDGTPCPDGDDCNGAETCRAGACAAGTPLACNDGNLCTSDRCVSGRGCVFTPVADGTGCGDTDACNGAEVCRAGACNSGPPLVCRDGNACTADSCDPVKGCVYTPIACDDGNTCTADSCDPVTGCAQVCLPDAAACGAGGTCIDCRCVELTVTGSVACASLDGPTPLLWLLLLLALTAIAIRRGAPKPARG